MRRFLFSSFLIFLTIPTLIFAQRDSLRSVFLDAESWFLFEEYSEALPLYESLYESDPGNDNLNYRMGICLLNDPYQKDKAIQHLLDASKNINPSYKEGSFKEQTAPPDALYYLGNAYQVNELLDHAIESYEKFLTVMDPEVYDEELVKAQIRSCKNAQRLKKMPVDIDLTLIDPIINTRYPDINPVLSGDGTKLAFVTELPFYDGAFFTEKQEDGWSYPQIITQMVGFDADVYPVALSYDGSEMILYFDDDYIGNLYYSKMENGMWSPATKMEPNISTKYWESNASFSKDGKSLYFTSNRKGSFGGLDIYLSNKQEDGSWGVPVNLGATINTRYNEECPVISDDGLTLYFSSYGHFNMGGYDIFYSKKGEDGSWGEPVNIGYPINTTDDDLYFHPTSDADGAYYSLYSPKGIGQHDIYYMNIYSVNNPRLYSISGTLRREDGRIDYTEMLIYVIDAESRDTLVFTSPTPEGNFTFDVKKGIYELHFKGEGYEDMIRPLQITDASDKEGVLLQDTVEIALAQMESLIFEGEESKIKLKESYYEGVAGTTILAPVKTSKRSTVIVKTYQDSVLLSTDTLVIEKRKTELEITPHPGKSIVVLEMIDEEGNIHRNRIEVSGTQPAIKELETQVGEEPFLKPVDPIHEGSLDIILLEAQRESSGELHDFLLELDPKKQEITRRRDLFDYLYQESPASEYTTNEVDILLSELISGEDASILLEKLIAQTDASLKEYLEQVNLEKEDINTSEELIIHLDEMAGKQGYEMGDIRKAMLDDLDQSEKIQQSLSRMFQNSDGALRTSLSGLNIAAERIETEKELYHYLYEQADQLNYSKSELDLMLATDLGGNDVELLRQQVLENSDGALKKYLQKLNLEDSGIRTSGVFLNHLEELALDEGFSMAEVREAMLESLDHSLEVERLRKELVSSTDGSVREILESLDLRNEGIYTPVELMDRLAQELSKKGFSKKEIEQILAQLFGETYEEVATHSTNSELPLALLLGFVLILGAGLLWFILVWWKRRQKGEKGEN
jgi:tetratricopeptide (TPR) repeat protein